MPAENVQVKKDNQEQTNPEESKQIQPKSTTPLDTTSNEKVEITVNPNPPSKH